MAARNDQLVITDAMFDLFVEMEDCRRQCPCAPDDHGAAECPHCDHWMDLSRQLVKLMALPPWDIYEYQSPDAPDACPPDAFMAPQWIPAQERYRRLAAALAERQSKTPA